MRSYPRPLSFYINLAFYFFYPFLQNRYRVTTPLNLPFFRPSHISKAQLPYTSFLPHKIRAVCSFFFSLLLQKKKYRVTPLLNLPFFFPAPSQIIKSVVTLDLHLFYYKYRVTPLFHPPFFQPSHTSKAQLP
jgi:hypothetical protein